MQHQRNTKSDFGCTLQLTKIFRYLRWQRCCDCAFAVFAVLWLFTRHLLLPAVIWSLYNDSPRLIRDGCYSGDPPAFERRRENFSPFGWEVLQPFKDPESLVCFDRGIRWMFLTALLALQVVVFPWTLTIFGVAFLRLRGGQTKDTRSEPGIEKDASEQREKLTSN